MELSKIAEAIGIDKKYPEEMDAIYASMPRDGKPACDLALIEQLQNDHNIFAEFYDLVVEMAKVINADENRSTWVKVAVEYCKDRPVAQARRVPVPKADGTQLSMILPLYILIPMIPMGIAEYRRRGFSEDEIPRIVKAYAGGMRIVKSHTGFAGINFLYFWWQMLFAKAAIFYANNLQFELRVLPEAVVYLKHRTTGELAVLMYKGLIHASGEQPVGSLGYEDDTGAFEAKFREDEENYYGYAVHTGLIDKFESTFSKAEWICAARPGDQCLSLHIPKKADISKETMEKAVADAYALAAQRYPEHKPVGVFGSSWILDPKLIGFTGENSKITNLIRMFNVYPQKTGGRSPFGYVFPKNCTNYEELPEDTSLQRKMKQLYLSGDCIHEYAGVIVK